MSPSRTSSSTRSLRQLNVSHALDLLAPLISLLGLYIFITSFFLAKRSLPHVSTCDEAASLLESTLNLTADDLSALQQQQHQQLGGKGGTGGCWVDRKVDSMVMVVVDALRFDFALHHLPRSVGARLQQLSTSTNNSTNSRLLQFVADPPTVTMQRLKALTTGGLPTFADISGNMGGATVEEDTWIQQLKSTPFQRRNLTRVSKTAFVGDDTWLDLFPTQLDEAYPYPSFNTRDLDTVDNGCLHHIPDLLNQLRQTGVTNEKFSAKDEEVMIVHFLGVDHVGHTYGPHNQHMDAKLKQMDTALFDMLAFMDGQEESCTVAFIFGDHGMTEDGNHGGGSDEEINAALFAHFSPACGNMTSFDDGSDASTTSDTSQTAFTSIHQIDLVPSLSLLLGLPIPYANLGSLVPALSLFPNAAQTATALALNAAQVWRYFTMYSTTANQLPGLQELEERLQSAVNMWKSTLSLDPDREGVSTDTLKACSLFKVFLLEALQLGQQVWTRFDTTGMTFGIVILGVGILVWILPFFLESGLSDGSVISWRVPPPANIWELVLTLLFVVFSCGVLTFGNSYILEEEHISMFMIGVLSFVLTIRLASMHQQTDLRCYAPLLIPTASRLGELFVTGHGQDPSTRAHNVHHAAIFLSSVVLLFVGRWYLFHARITVALSHMIVDCVALLCLGQSWWEKRDPDTERHGFGGTRCAIVLVAVSLLHALFCVAQTQSYQAKGGYQALSGDTMAIIIKILVLIMIVTGPSAATSAVLFSGQAAAIILMSKMTGPSQVSAAIVFNRCLHDSSTPSFAINTRFECVRSPQPYWQHSVDLLFATFFSPPITAAPSAGFSCRPPLWQPQHSTLSLQDHLFSSIHLAGKLWD